MRCLALLLAAACSSAPEACPMFIGDREQAATIDIVTLGADGTPATAADGAQVDLIRPPQGGKIVLAGMRARNVCPGPIDISAALTDPCTGRIVGIEGRRVVFVAAADGFAEASDPTQLSSYANVAVCPNNVAVRSVEDQAYQLTVTMKDALGRVAEKEITVTPVCAEPQFEIECRCTCAAGYRLGQPCAAQPDAGPAATACPADAGTP